MALSGHVSCADGCPLSGVKRTSRFQSVMSASDPKRTLRRASLSGCALVGPPIYRSDSTKVSRNPRQRSVQYWGVAEGLPGNEGRAASRGRCTLCLVFTLEGISQKICAEPLSGASEQYLCARCQLWVNICRNQASASRPSITDSCRTSRQVRPDDLAAFMAPAHKSTPIIVAKLAARLYIVGR